MDDMKLWYVCLIIGIVFFVAGLFSFFINRKNKEKAFAKMSILELIAAMVLIFPDVYLNEGTINILVLIKCFLFTFLDVLKIFSGNGYEERKEQSCRGFLRSGVGPTTAAAGNVSRQSSERKRRSSGSRREHYTSGDSA